MLILCQSHHGVYACILGRATALGGVGQVLALEYMMSGAPGLLRPCPVVSDS
jgi:hypothetical protein